MLDIAILDDCDDDGNSTVETNSGEILKCQNWPTDCDFQIVAFRPSDDACETVDASEIVSDISCAIEALKASGSITKKEPEWFKRLVLCAAG